MRESEARTLKLDLLRNSKYFIPHTFGGYNKYTNVRNTKTHALLPNCTGGAYGLALQYMQTTDYKKCELPRDDAGRWYLYNTNWKKSKYPVIGAICCWKNGNKGHVAVVKDVKRNANGNVTAVEILESSYYSYNKKDWRCGWNTYKYNANTGYLTKSGYTFQGYLLCPNITLDPITDELKVGDKVEIIAKGNSRKDGKGKTSGGIGWTRYILKVFPTAKYPYQIGNAKGVITGYYTAKALKKVK